MPGEGGPELRVRRAGRGLGVVVGVEAEAVQLWSGRLALAMKCRPGTIVDVVEAGVHLGVCGEGVSGLRVHLQQRVAEHRARRQQEPVDA